MPGPPPIDGPIARWCASRTPPWSLQRLADELRISREAVRLMDRRGTLDRRTELALERLAQLTDAAMAK